ncbi:MAG TPA: 23S rRNA (uracil(1939)-C(5))-methyltransferase RlmD [Geobacteraceae bacterium]|nr:23S rRNA (uracil(1939)-C(5))-methyltransferase RlmD [Geobacteraceae bacterium]
MGHVDGKVCFVPFTAPGDIARVGIKREKRSYLEGELRGIVEPASHRTEPACPVFGLCGGCSWQHIPYADQLLAKEEIFAGILWRQGRVPRERIMPIVPAPEPLAYRSRAQFKIHCTGEVSCIGFYRAGSHFVVDIPGKCAIVHPVINRLLAGLRDVLTSFPEAVRIPQIDVAVGDDGQAELVVHYIGELRQDVISHFRQHCIFPEVSRIYLQTGRKSTLATISGDGEDALSYRVPNGLSPDRPDIILSFGGGVFSQVNYRQNLALIETVRGWAQLTGKEKILDLFCGNGNFALPLAAGASQITGVEEFRPSLDFAIRNGRANHADNVAFVCGDAAGVVSAMISEGRKFDIVILDPPREGAAVVAGIIPALEPRTVIYVSCDPATLARDIGIMKKSGYDVLKSRPVDMFPQTYHIESVTMLAPAPGEG